MTRKFYIVWAGQMLSLVGSSLLGFGVGVWLYNETDSYFWLSILFVVATGTELLAIPFLGLVDRFDRRAVMVVADCGAALGSLVLFIVWWRIGLHPWFVVAGALAGLFGLFQTSAYAATVPELVEKEDLDRANGLVQLGPALALVLGPAFGAVFLASFGIAFLFVVDLVTFAVGIGAVLSVGFGSPALSRNRISETSLDSETVDDGRTRDAWHWLRVTGRSLLALLFALAVLNVVLGLVQVVVIGLADELAGTARAGWPTALGGVAMVVTSILLGSAGLGSNRVRVVAGSAIAFGVFCVLAGSRPWFWLLCVGAALAFGMVPVFVSAASTVIQERAPSQMLGRIFGIRSIVGAAAMPIGSAIAGPLGTWSPSGTLVAAGLGMVVVGIAAGASRGLAVLNTMAPQTGAFQ